MRCSICGAKLKNEGDICTNCYKAYQEEEDLKKDTKETLKLKRKYSIAYEIVKYTEVIVIFILASIFSLSVGGVINFLITLFICALLIGILLFVDKRIAIGTEIIFYEKKVRYKFKFLFFKTDRIVKYTDISDAAYFQTHRQKKFGYGDLCIYTKGIIPGIGYLNGIHIENLENIEQVFKNVGEILGPVLDLK